MKGLNNVLELLIGFIFIILFMYLIYLALRFFTRNLSTASTTLIIVLSIIIFFVIIIPMLCSIQIFAAIFKPVLCIVYFITNIIIKFLTFILSFFFLIIPLTAIGLLVYVKKKNNKIK